jgi:hypothetical protein
MTVGDHRALCKTALAIAAFSTATLLSQTCYAQESPEQGPKDARQAPPSLTKDSESFVRTAVRNAQRLSATDIPEALKLLRKTLARLQEDAAISPERRVALGRMLEDRIRVFEFASNRNAVGSEEQIAKQAESAYRRAEEENRRKSDEMIKRLMDGIKKLREEGRTGDASRQASAAAQRYPETVALQANNRISSVLNQLESNRQLQSDRAGRMTGALAQVDKSRALPKDDIEFPKNWKEITKGRGNESRLSAKERAILRTLDSPISVRFENTSLKDVIEYLQTYLGQPITIDMAALKAAEIPYDSAVTINVKNVSVRTLLRRILADVGLTYAIRDEAIEVTTPQKARGATVVRVYYVGDLLGEIPALWGLRAVELMDLIQTTVQPESWRRNGGSGSIYFHPITRAIVVKQGVENQAVISDTIR